MAEYKSTEITVISANGKPFQRKGTQAANGLVVCVNLRDPGAKMRTWMPTSKGTGFTRTQFRMSINICMLTEEGSGFDLVTLDGQIKDYKGNDGRFSSFNTFASQIRDSKGNVSKTQTGNAIYDYTVHSAFEKILEQEIARAKADIAENGLTKAVNTQRGISEMDLKIMNMIDAYESDRPPAVQQQASVQFAPTLNLSSSALFSNES